MKEILKAIIRQFHTAQIPGTLKRQTELPLSSSKVIVVIGPRRAGKTYLLFQHIHKLIEKGLSREKILYLNLEDERLDLTQQSLDLILQAYRELYPDLDLKECYFFFDEVQNIQGWERFIRRVYDTVSKNIFITGSNSKLLGKEIATSLRGRTLRYELFPLNFKEFLYFKNFQFDPQKDLYIPEVKAKIIQLFHEYMVYGGFPEVAFLDEHLKTKTLQDYFEVMLYRDIAERYHVKDSLLLKYFLKRLAESVGRFFSVHKIYNEIKSQGFRIGKDSLYSYVAYAETAYMIRLLRKQYKSVKKAEFGEKKVYLIDTGLLSSIRSFEGKNYGILFENLIFNELLQRYNDIVCFKEKRECDFVVGGKDAFQVCFDVSEPDTLKREIMGLTEACKYFGLKKGYLITYDMKKVVDSKGVKIYIVPWYEVLFSFY